MLEPKFAQPERRPPVVSIAIAMVVLAAIVLLVGWRMLPESSVGVALAGTKVLPQTTKFKSDSIVIGFAETNSSVFVVPTLRVKNEHRIPVTLDDFRLTLTDASGAEETEAAIYKADLPNLERMFPALRPMMGTRLEPGTVVQPGETVEGTMLFSMKVPESLWNARKSAVVKVEIYHEAPIAVTIPKP